MSDVPVVTRVEKYTHADTLRVDGINVVFLRPSGVIDFITVFSKSGYFKLYPQSDGTETIKLYFPDCHITLSNIVKDISLVSEHEAEALKLIHPEIIPHWDEIMYVVDTLKRCQTY